ncbi:MAG: hypothetical protein ACRCWO_09060 [Bosea sp. (in: a-proteobacteria)]
MKLARQLLERQRASAASVSTETGVTARPTDWRLQAERKHGVISSAAAFLGMIASTGLRSPSARFGMKMSMKLSAGALGLALAASFVPFVMEVANTSATAGVEAVSTPALRRDLQAGESLSATLAKFDPAKSDPMNTASLGEWSRVQKPIAIFGLGAQDLAGQNQRYEGFRHSKGGRDDRLIYGALAAKTSGAPTGSSAQGKPETHLQLSFLRDGAAPRSLFLDLVSQGADSGIAIERIQQSSLINTKFGGVETADAMLSQGDTKRACLGFRHVNGETNLRIAGWWCAADGRPADRRQLACMIDRIALLSAGDDKALRAVFSQAEKNRDPACNPARIAQIGRKTSWLDADAPAPALRSATLTPKTELAQRKAP